MASKTLATIVIVFAFILLFPISIGILGGGLFGAIFGLIGGILHRIFGWPFRIFHCNFFAMVLILLLVFVAAKSGRRRY